MLLGLLAASALGFVDIYSNPFSKSGQYRQVSAVNSGKKCDRDFSKGHGIMAVTVKAGPAVLVFTARSGRRRPA